jgi:uncharacterized protein (TIGR00725 family)
MGRIIIGVMGPGENASLDEIESAYELGQQIAVRGWVTLCGGRNCGVMAAVCRGASQAGGLTVGILAAADTAGAAAVDIAIATGLGSARNNINVLSSDVIVACGMGAGTASEVALALKAQKAVILLKAQPETQIFFKMLNAGQVFCTLSVNEAMVQIQTILNHR